MVPAAAWMVRPMVAMRVTKRRMPVVVHVIRVVKIVIEKIKEVFSRISEAPKIIRRILKPWSQGPP